MTPLPPVDRLRGVAGSDVSDRVMPRAPAMAAAAVSSSAKLSGLKEMPLGESTVVLLWLHGLSVSRSEKDGVRPSPGLKTSSSPSSSLCVCDVEQTVAEPPVMAAMTGTT